MEKSRCRYRTPLAAFIAALLLAAAADATALTVTSPVDGGGTCPGATCSLRQAIVTASSGDTINFSLPSGVTTINLTSDELLIDKNLTINGPGANLLTVQRSFASGTPNFRIFDIASAVNVTISNLTIANGSNNSNGGGIFNTGTLTLSNSVVSGNTTIITSSVDVVGGGIFNMGSLTLSSSTVSGNTIIRNSSGAARGGGIYNSDNGTVTITNSTISGNTAGIGGGDNGGGIYNSNNNSSVTYITNSTISGNSAGDVGGGVYSLGRVNTRNTIIAKNTAPSSAPDFHGPFHSLGYNLIGNTDGASIFGVLTGNQLNVDPLLGSLQDNGGPTFTHALLSGSPAIDGGDSSGSITDQRGFLRPVDDPGIANASGGDGSDIGAYEVQADVLPGCKNVNQIVNNTNDSDPDSLRAVINTVCAGSTITFASNVRDAINLTSGELQVNKSLTIQGPGANLLSVQRSAASGTANFRIFNITGNPNVTISGLTIANGNTPSLPGGGISLNTGTLTLTNATISGNTASNGGGIFTSGTLTLTNSTISGNTVSSTFNAGSGGGICNQGGTVALSSSTISGNSAIGPGGNSDLGGGIITNGGTVTLTNSTISGNSGDLGGGIRNINGGTVRSANTIIALNTSPSGPDINGALTSQGFNLIGDASGAAITPAQFSDQIGVTAAQLNLGPLQDNGGPTRTHALLSGSFALDKGYSFGLTTDQRGFPRPVDFPDIPNVNGGDGSDIGAFEVGPLVPLSAVSRKTHGSTDVHDIDLPLTGATIGIECRRNTGADVSGPNAGRDHELIITFPSAVTVGGASVTSNDATDTPTATSSVSSNIVTVDLHNIPNARRLSINLTSVSDGTTTNNVSVPMGVLVGDTTGDGNVNSGDIAQTKSKSGQTVAASNFRADLTVDGNLNSGDIALVKSKSGTALPP